MQPIFALARILGNEMPPRDIRDGRLISLQHLLREPPLCGVVKIWILNRIWDLDLASKYRQLLSYLPKPVHIYEIPFEPDRYFDAPDHHGRLLYCPGINNARNEGLRIAFEQHRVRFAAVFDGDCGFTPHQWEDVSTEILGDCIQGVDRSAYSVPMTRIEPEVWDHALVGPPNVIPDDPHEPQLIFSRKAWENGLWYDPSLAFDEDDKVALLIKLGHSGWVDRWHEVLNDEQCRSVGRCCHVNTGSSEVESCIHRQWHVRQPAKLQMYEDIARYYGRKTNGSA